MTVPNQCSATVIMYVCLPANMLTVLRFTLEVHVLVCEVIDVLLYHADERFMPGSTSWMASSERWNLTLQPQLKRYAYSMQMMCSYSSQGLSMVVLRNISEDCIVLHASD